MVSGVIRRLIGSARIDLASASAKLPIGSHINRLYPGWRRLRTRTLDLESLARVEALGCRARGGDARQGPYHHRWPQQEP
jgi:hypothetical protein